jgi:chromosome segregation ATPase
MSQTQEVASATRMLEEQLREAEAALKKRWADVDQNRKVIADTQRRLDAAIRALDGNLRSIAGLSHDVGSLKNAIAARYSPIGYGNAPAMNYEQAMEYRRAQVRR